MRNWRLSAFESAGPETAPFHVSPRWKYEVETLKGTIRNLKGDRRHGLINIYRRVLQMYIGLYVLHLPSCKTASIATLQVFNLCFRNVLAFHNMPTRLKTHAWECECNLAATDFIVVAIKVCVCVCVYLHKAVCMRTPVVFQSLRLPC